MYVAMSGAKETLRAQAANNHNLANAATTGFRADLTAFMSRDVTGPGFDSRAYATTSTTGWKQDTGAILSTGRDTDVAINGAGWIAVQAPEGTEAYTRAGDLRVDTAGQLVNAAGRVVLGDGGPIAVPPHQSIMIGGDGTVSIVPLGQRPDTTVNVGRIKLVNPDPQQIERRDDGLFSMRDGSSAPADAAVKLTSGALESSNVNTADAMVQMIELARRFDLQLKSIRAADDNARSASSPIVAPRATPSTTRAARPAIRPSRSFRGVLRSCLRSARSACGSLRRGFDPSVEILPLGSRRAPDTVAERRVFSRL